MPIVNISAYKCVHYTFVIVIPILRLI